MEIDLYQLKTIDSTNSWAKREAAKFHRNSLTIITAQGQTAGRGRFNRRWISPVDQNIYASFCFFVPQDRRDITNIPQVIGLALTVDLNKMHFKTRLRWPNDLLIHGRKVGGILCETIPFTPDTCVIAGVGLNVNMGPEWLQEIGQPATSMAVESGCKLNLDMVYGMVIRSISNAIENFLQEGFLHRLPDYRNYLSHAQGELLQVRNGKRVLTGKFMGIDDEGCLQLQLADGTVTALIAGEVS